eukprot:UN01829
MNEVSVDNTVLLYKDMTELVYKVLEDISTINKRIEHELAEKMISKQKTINNFNIGMNEKEKNNNLAHSHIAHGYILSQRMSVSLARDVPQIGSPKNIKSKKNSNISEGKAVTKYEKMRYESDDDEDDVYNMPVNNRSNTLPVAGLSKKSSIFGTHPDLRKIKSSDKANDMYTSVDFVKQRALSMDDDWLRKVMSELIDDDENDYDYSPSHKL